MIIQRFGRYFLFTRFSIRENTPPYYLLAIRENPDYDKEDFVAFVDLLKDLLYK